jgi:hypothetical protein
MNKKGGTLTHRKDYPHRKYEYYFKYMNMPILDYNAYVEHLSGP